MLAAGAGEVELGGGAPQVRSEAELPRSAMRGSTCAACASPASTPPAPRRRARTPPATRSTPRAALRGVEGVWVADGSILPSCPGVNPQVSIMAIAAGVGEIAAGGK